MQLVLRQTADGFIATLSVFGFKKVAGAFLDFYYTYLFSSPVFQPR